MRDCDIVIDIDYSQKRHFLHISRWMQDLDTIVVDQFYERLANKTPKECVALVWFESLRVPGLYACTYEED